MKQFIDFDTQLKTVPVRNHHVEIVRSDKDPDVLIVQVALRYKGFLKLAKRVLKLRNSKRFELAGLSRVLYEKLDGKINVESLVLWLQKEEKLTFFEARAFIVQYLSDLMRRGLVVVIPDAELQNRQIEQAGKGNKP